MTRRTLANTISNKHLDPGRTPPELCLRFLASFLLRISLFFDEPLNISLAHPRALRYFFWAGIRVGFQLRKNYCLTGSFWPALSTVCDAPTLPASRGLPSVSSFRLKSVSDAPALLSTETCTKLSPVREFSRFS